MEASFFCWMSAGGWSLFLGMSQHDLLFHQVSKRKRGPAMFCNIIAYILFALPYSVDQKQVMGPVHIPGERITQGLDTRRRGRLCRGLLKSVSASLPYYTLNFYVYLNPFLKPHQLWRHGRGREGCIKMGRRCSSFPSPCHEPNQPWPVADSVSLSPLAAGFIPWLNLTQRLPATFMPTLRVSRLS